MDRPDPGNYLKKGTGNACQKRSPQSPFRPSPPSAGKFRNGLIFEKFANVILLGSIDTFFNSKSSIFILCSFLFLNV